MVPRLCGRKHLKTLVEFDLCVMFIVRIVLHTKKIVLSCEASEYTCRIRLVCDIHISYLVYYFTKKAVLDCEASEYGENYGQAHRGRLQLASTAKAALREHFSTLFKTVQPSARAPRGPSTGLRGLSGLPVRRPFSRPSRTLCGVSAGSQFSTFAGFSV